MSKKFDVVAVTGTYKDQNGNDKARYMNIGVVIEKANGKGFALKLEAIPTDWNGWAELFEPKPKEEKQEQRPSDDRSFDDKIPFAFVVGVPLVSFLVSAANSGVMA